MTSEKKPGKIDFDNYTEILKALAHPVRLMIINQLLDDPNCVMAIHEILDIRQSNISQHLTILKNSGIVAFDSDGSYRCYYLRKPGLIKAVIKALGNDWPESKINDIRKHFRKELNRHHK